MEALDQFEYALADSGLGGGVQEKIQRVLRDGYPTEEGIHYVERRTAILNMYLPTTGRKTKRARCDAAVGDTKAEVNADTIPTDAAADAARCTTCGWSMTAPRHTHRTKPCLQCWETGCTEDCVVHDDEEGKVIAMVYCAAHGVENMRKWSKRLREKEEEEK
jgi:hypothetical protein